ncbi:MAG: phospholipase D-like domain-containing protein [Clostridium sp.]|nr:phospholipase D-like domain-containing protein [Clostridium sp.]
MKAVICWFCFTLFLLFPAVSVSAGSSAERSDSATVRDLQRLGVRFSANNRLVLLTSGAEKFDDMFRAIRQARRFVHLEYFNFRNDSVGAELFRLLAAKARQGVKVRALFDGYGNSSNDRPLKQLHMDSLRKAGVEIYAFDPVVFPWINHAYHRDHRKIVVVDGELVYTGGMNVADYYIHGKPEFGPWRDMHMRIEGDAVTEYERIFRQMWALNTGEWLNGPEYYPGCRDASVLFEGLKPDTCSTAGRKLVGVVDRIPLTQPKLMRQAYVAAIDNATCHIQIVNPYLTLVKSVRKAIHRALRRGVRVEIMVSTKSDIPITPDVVAYEMNKLMKRGAEIYFYETGFHHTKIMMVDDSFCTVGSANLNSRSMSYDYEVNAFVMDAGTTAQLQQLFEQDKQHCTRLTRDNWPRRRSVKRRFLGWLYHFLGPFI